MPANRQNNSNFFNYGALIESRSQRTAAASASQAKNASTQGPANASAAPVAGEQNVFTGLTDALNNYQKELVQLKKRKVADQYAIEFAPASIGASTVKRPGPQDATTAPMQTPNSAAKIVPAENSVKRDARTWPINAGTQIIKVIDDVLRNSSFVTDQQNVDINTATDPVTGVQTQKVNAKAGTGDMKWYKISVSAQQIGYDTIIRDHAYLMKFIITPYAVAQMTSQYFPDSRYKGVHKAYQYWFTGENTQILSYEQNYNNAYRLVLSGIGADAQKETTTDFRDQNRYIFMATSQNQSTGAKNYANEPGNNAASFLYDPVSLSQVKLRILGDPAWMQQGEAGLGISSSTFNFSPFNADGGINYDSQAVMFSVAFNTPADYDFNTGLVNVNASSRNGQPQEYYTFQATKCKNYFSKGRFEQEIEGKLVIEKNTKQNTNQGRPTAGNNSVGSAIADTSNTRSNALLQSQADAQDLENGANAGTGTGDTNSGFYNDAEYNGPQTTQPASAPGAPTSSGDVAPADTPAPQNANTTDKVLANEEETAAVNAYVAAGGTFPRGTGPITSGPLFDNVVAAKASLTARQQAAAGSATTSAPPQQIAKDDS